MSLRSHRFRKFSRWYSILILIPSGRVELCPRGDQNYTVRLLRNGMTSSQFYKILSGIIHQWDRWDVYVVPAVPNLNIYLPVYQAA